MKGQTRDEVWHLAHISMNVGGLMSQREREQYKVGVDDLDEEINDLPQNKREIKLLES